MPELPEVETIKLQLQKYLVGHTIKSVEVKNRRIFQGEEKEIVDAKVLDIRRFGKVVVIDLSNNYSILIHVKLTGQIIYRGLNLKSESLSKKVVGGVGGAHTHVTFNLDQESKIYYNDIRQFGWIRVVKTEDVMEESFIKKLGPDMLQISLADFQIVLSKTARAVKVCLMDQAKIGGIGNIYANDALWLSKIDPKTPAKSLSTDRTEELFNALHTVLMAGLKYGGASELAFVTPDGAEGQYQNHTLVYAHTGEVCKSCDKNKIEKYYLSGRGTYWCASCQK